MEPHVACFRDIHFKVGKSKETHCTQQQQSKFSDFRLSSLAAAAAAAGAAALRGRNMVV